METENGVGLGYGEVGREASVFGGLVVVTRCRSRSVAFLSPLSTVCVCVAVHLTPNENK